MRRRSLIALTATMPFAAAAQQGGAQQGSGAWTAATEYPAGAMPAEGLTRLAEAARPLVITPAFDAPGGVRSAAMPRAVAEGRFAIGDAFAGALGELDPVFLLSSLPFLATSAAEAKRLLVAARPAYQEALETLGVTLLHVTPWPPTGIWSRRPIATPADLRGLKLRTYDATGTETMRALGAEAEQLSFQAVATRLADGSMDAVLSSGDGGAGRRLWEHLPHFTEIGYAMPVSLAFGDPARLRALTEDQRAGLERAATRTETGLWTLLETRDAANKQRMRENGVTIAQPAAPLLAALREAGGVAVKAWEAKAGATGSEILALYRSGG
ncbi:TRAP transporter substrate-binding protein [Falsiroseomonas sp.]|uniref:TRAP transporter substrate-binding protein n=1 Tax=Falsiroseomonas sp. TaxID=2870721 RepID=UPI00271D0A06|nr:TRAP transporter substrate-binding protein [Falsiroseomonas sp.]MDO9498581.1 TRAP transporter substrate-binding protein [Falsiroseomonas sp.]